MIVRKTDRIIIQGITGKQGTFWTERMQEYGSNIVGGVNPKKPGIVHCGVPVVESAKSAQEDIGFDISVLFIPPLGVKDAALDAIHAGAKGLVILTEHVPVKDVMYVLSAARERGVKVLGPNTAGTVTPQECFCGFMPAFNEKIFLKGSVGVVSRSGSLGTLVCLNIVQSGFGISAFIGIGGDPIIGTTTLDAVKELYEFETTDAIVIVGEIGGDMEERAADYIANLSKPICAFIAGAAAPKGKKMGHAGAIVMGNKGTYISKKRSLEKAGAFVMSTPDQVGATLKEHLKV
ncbi:MAG: Succinyl-CoA ligase [ADP-forming] subunit alpha [Alphaproteobacteria bacterium MarineAlpha3_Bin5]|nr:succinyl-CoA synthetase subunit alpha [Magnetovibrio sp.]PPR78057.1 MAG: Succinyl-CoA ligase [ADP-forming] subunit alpha [Alphaproteobacteria bacterium MarineAlpha3_Bin5]